jgi:hypothetical protein
MRKLPCHTQARRGDGPPIDLKGADAAVLDALERARRGQPAAGTRAAAAD